MHCRAALLTATLLMAATACADGGTQNGASPSTTTTAPVTTAPATTATPTTMAERTEIRLKIDRQVDDAATSSFPGVLEETLKDPRGWSRAGFVFVFGDDAPYSVVLAEGDVVDELCRPYDVGGRFSCQNGPVVALNADRWRAATPQWTGDLDTYRQMLVNHEVGHLLGQHHPEEQCPGRGEPAPVMAQQSTELDGCRPNPWPLEWEVRCAALGLEPLAPGYEPDPEPRCGPQTMG